MTYYRKENITPNVKYKKEDNILWIELNVTVLHAYKRSFWEVYYYNAYTGLTYILLRGTPRAIRDTVADILNGEIEFRHDFIKGGEIEDVEQTI